MPRPLERRFALLLAARTISLFGNAFGPIALAFGVLGLPGATPATLAIVLAGHTIPQLGLMLIGGVIGDRFARSRVLVTAELLSCLAYAGIALMLLTGRAPVALLTGCAVVAGSASAILLPTLTGVVPDVVEREHLQRANALLRLGGNAANICGLLLAGAVVALLSPGIALAVDAATYLVAALFLLGIGRTGSDRSRSRGLVGDLSEGFGEFVRRQWLWTVVVSAAFVNAGIAAAFGVLGPVLARSDLGGAVPWSIVLAAYTAGMLVSALPAMRLEPVRPLVAAALTTPVLALPLLALGFGTPFAVVLVAAFAAGAALNLFGVLWETVLQRHVPAEALSRVTSCNYVVALSLKPIAIVLAGHAAAGFGAGPAMLVLGATLAVVGLAPLVSPQVRRLTDRMEVA